ncbi:MAG: SDR family oxidoreductase [Rhizomicrobium sp.]
MTQPLQLFCFGFGYTAQVLARRLTTLGGQVRGTVRTETKMQALRTQGFDSLLFENRHAVLNALLNCDLVLISAPPTTDGDPVLAAFGEAIMQACPKWLGYLSTTGVYGDCAGRWVDETSPVAPASPRAQRRAMAECAWQDLAAEIARPCAIFRLPGIYGPARSPIDALREGRARRIDKPGQVFSRIHVDDLVETLIAAMTRSAEGIFNVCDDEPAPQHEVVAHAARLLGIPAPPLEPFVYAEATLSPMARSFYGESKRVCNAKMKRELGVQLRYPSFREGLAGVL